MILWFFYTDCAFSVQSMSTRFGVPSEIFKGPTRKKKSLFNVSLKAAWSSMFKDPKEWKIFWLHEKAWFSFGKRRCSTSYFKSKVQVSYVERTIFVKLLIYLVRNTYNFYMGSMPFPTRCKAFMLTDLSLNFL